jgi:hypothetical protein
MQAHEAWIAIFRRIPADLQDGLSLGLTTGAEIVVQKILKLDPDFMMIRGRVAGTQDTGRVVFIPYGQLTYVAITRDLKDAEVEAIFGKGAPPAANDLPPAAAAAPEPVAEKATVSQEAPAVNPPKAPAPVSRAALVAKVRDRLKDQGPGGK